MIFYRTNLFDLAKSRILSGERVSFFCIETETESETNGMPLHEKILDFAGAKASF
jgi:hypothetical protein